MSDVFRVVLATRNEHKVAEIQRILADAGAAIELLPLSDFPDAGDVAETGLTFAENALLKSRAAHEATGLPALADDSGLSVDALNGMPGVFSARWAGPARDDGDNMRLLLEQLSDVPEEHRGAAFVCVAALVMPSGETIVQEGTVTGRLTTKPRGENGFGYDPIFVPDGDTRTTAEMSADEKDAISHRGRAFRALAKTLTSSTLGSP